MEKRLLAVFAHPDDEAFSVGGTLPLYAERGAAVALVCATRGEVGEIADPSLATPETLGEVRESELDCAAQSMGVKQLVFLDYRDSGMPGTAENDDPRAFMNVPPERVVERLAGIIRRFQPQVVITFDPNGAYGHPDHIAIHNHTVAAFHAAADATRYPEQGPAWQAERLFYTAMPRSLFRQMREMLVEMGQDISDLDWIDDDAGLPDEEINAVVDVSETVDEKWEALNCHRTQFGPDNLFRRLPEEMVKEGISHEHFVLAWPTPQPGAVVHDLFAGLGRNGASG
jgi:LmbE family N-acetylglucosaminyl deacetylase